MVFPFIFWLGVILWKWYMFFSLISHFRKYVADFLFHTDSWESNIKGKLKVALCILEWWKLFIIPNGNQCPHIQSNNCLQKINLCALQIFSHVDCQELMCLHNYRVDRFTIVFTKYVFTTIFHHPLVIMLQKIVSISKIVKTMRLYKIPNFFSNNIIGNTLI